MEIITKFKLGEIKIDKNERSVAFWLKLLAHSSIINLKQLKDNSSNFRDSESRDAQREACTTLINQKLKR